MKSFTRSATSVAILAALATSGHALAETKGPTIFGKAHVSFGSVSEDPTGAAPETSSTEVKSHASRFGVKGAIDTDGSTQVVYRFVWEVDMTDNAKGSADNIKSREQYVGLKDSWGEIRIGRDDSPYKKAGKKNVEHMSDTWADYNNIINKDADLRNDDSIGFWTKAGPGKLGLQYGAGADNAGSGQENESDVISLAYDIKMGAIGFAVAFQEQSETATGAQDGAEGTKIVLGYKLGDTQFGIISESIDQEVGGGADEDNMLVSVKHKMGKSAIKFAYGTKDVDGVVDDATMTALSYEYKLSKKTSVYGLWADGADGGLAKASKLDGDASALVAGIVAKF